MEGGIIHDKYVDFMAGIDRSIRDNRGCYIRTDYRVVCDRIGCCDGHGSLRSSCSCSADSYGYRLDRLLDEKHRLNVEPTNADRVLGKEGIVIKTIDPMEGKGQVKVIGQTWSAKSDRVIEEGRKIRVTGMEGVKLIVEEMYN